MQANWNTSLAFVWQPGFDDPNDGYHITPGDAGGATFGGVIEGTWHAVASRGVVSGNLANATRDQLSAVLADACWGSVCDTLPSGLDLLFFNGTMMTGAYSKLFQQCLGMVGSDVDGAVGPMTLGQVVGLDVPTLIHALTGAHYAYLTGLSSWARFGGGWGRRVLAARAAAMALVTSDKE